MFKRIVSTLLFVMIFAGLVACAATSVPSTPATVAPAPQGAAVPTSPPIPTPATVIPSPTAVSPTTAPASSTITVTDFRGKAITLGGPVSRIACVLPNVLNDLYMLGLTKEIVGVHQWSLSKDNPDYPFITQIDPRLATGELQALNGNVEKIVSLKPDIAILQATDEIIPTLEKDGIKVYGVQVADFDGVTKLMQDLGKITGKEARAKEIIDYTANKLDTTRQKISTIPDDRKPKGLFVWGPSTLDVAGSISTGNAILVASGSKNVAASINQEHFVAKMEQVVNWNPDVIVIWYTDKLKVNDYLTDSSWQMISAVSKKQVYMLPNGFYTDLWTPKYQFAIVATAKWMYPDLFASVNLEDEQKQMIKALYHFDFKY